MTIVIIIIVIILFIVIKFVSDSNKVANENTRNGGLINKHKCFVEYCDNPISIYRMELVKNTGKTLEYRLPIKKDNQLKGYIHFGLEDTFTVAAFCSAVSVNGNRHKGFMKELKNWSVLDSSDYDKIFESMVSSMASTDEFEKLELN